MLLLIFHIKCPKCHWKNLHGGNTTLSNMHMLSSAIQCRKVSENCFMEVWNQ